MLLTTTYSCMQIFGKILVCRTLEGALKTAKEYKMPCITLEGERVEPRGGMDGGYFDKSASHLEAVKVRNDNRTKLVELEKEQTVINEKTAELDQSVTRILGEISIVESRHSDLKLDQDDHRSKIKTLMLSIKDAERALQSQNVDLKTMQDRHGDLEELGSRSGPCKKSWGRSCRLS